MTTRHSRGFALIELLFVVLILMILVGGYGYFGGFGEGVDQGTAEMAMDRASNTACQVSRQAAEANIEMWQISHVGEPLSPQVLQQAGISMRCPHSHSNGMYVYVDGSVYCTDHFPPPANRAPVGAAAPPQGVPQITLPPVPQMPTE